MDGTFTAEGLSALAGTLAALGFAYIPGLRTKFAGLSAEAKSGIMAIVLLVIGGLVVASSCTNLWIYVSCTKRGILEFVQVVAYALVLNQSTYTLLPETKDVKAIKAARKLTTPPVA